MSADGTFTIGCPTCQARLRLKLQPPFPEGKKVVCPRCQTSIRLADATAAPTHNSPDRSSRHPDPRPEPSRKPNSSGQAEKRDSERTQRKEASSTKAPSDRTHAGRPTPRGDAEPRKKSHAAPGIGNSTGAGPAGNPASERRKPPALDPWEAEADAAEAQEDNPWDDSDLFNEPDQNDDAASDSWSPPAALPPRRRSGRNASGDRDSDTSRSSRRAPTPRIQSLGVFGWVLAGGAGGLIVVVLMTLMEFTHVPFLAGLMMLVSGPLVGGCVRYAAGDSHGWGPGLTAAAIALISIMCGKFGAAYVSLGDLARKVETAAIQGNENTTQEQRIAQQTTDPHLIAGLATEIQDNWLASGKITEQQLEQHLAAQFPEDAEEHEGFPPEQFDTPDMDTGGDIEFVAVDISAADIAAETAEEPARTVPVDPASGFLPEVWQEATRQWESRSPEEKQARVAEMRQQIVENEKEVAELIPRGRFLLAIPLAFINIFRPLGNLLLLFSGIAAAFRIGSHLASSDSGR